MPLTGSKSLIASVTFRGIVIAAITPILQLFGVDVGNLLSDAVQHVVELVGLAIALYGRFRARQTIGGLFSSGGV